MSHTSTWTARFTPRSKRALIYALGGGSGHTQRAQLLASYFSSATILLAKPPKINIDVTWVCPQNQPLFLWVKEYIKKHHLQYDVLVVDTFPQGIGHELTQEHIQYFPMQLFIARYLREEAYPNYEQARAWYTHS